MSGPAETATEAIRDLRYQDLTPTRRRPHFEDVVVAEAVLTALHAAGWRIVRTSTCECGQPDSVHAGFVPYPTGEHIVDEFTPEATP